MPFENQLPPASAGNVNGQRSFPRARRSAQPLPAPRGARGGPDQLVHTEENGSLSRS
jgi:hypothetical protein